MYKIIISDDEVLECRALEKMIYENISDVQILPPAANGIELVSAVERETPDIVVVDINMPGMNGLDACEVIQGRHPGLKILVVSAYSRFEYAQKAVMLGASDYILKPVKEELLVRAVRRLCRQIDQERKRQEEEQGMGRILKDYYDTVENEFMASLILGKVSDACWEKYQGLLSHPFYGAFVVCVQSDRQEEGEKNRFYEQFLQSMKKICTCSGRVQDERLFLCVSPTSPGAEESRRSWIENNLECVCRSLEAEGRCAIGVSGFTREFPELPAKISESRSVQMGNQLPGIHFPGKEQAGEGHAFSFGKKEVCRRLAKSGQYDALEQMLEESKEQLKQEGTVQTLKFFLLELLHDVFEGIRKYRGAEGEYPLFESWVYWKRLLQQDSFDGLFEAAGESFRQIRSFGERFKYNRYIAGSLDYISSHYMEDIALETVADHINISSFYLSRLFKQELNYTFLETLTDARISRVIDLLYEGSFSTQEIGERCGYPNISYFYKLFKKQTGMTVGEMREMIQIGDTVG